MVQEAKNELIRIYNAFSDDISRNIYKHRLLYSLFGEYEDIQEIVKKWSASRVDLSAPKICYYGAGAGGRFAMNYVRKESPRIKNPFSFCVSEEIPCLKIPFIIDGYKTGTLDGCPIISFDDFLKLPDFREYLVLITVGTDTAQREIKAKLNQYGLRYAFVFYDCDSQQQYFEIKTMCPDMCNEYFVDAGALDGTTTKSFLDNFPDGHAYVFEPSPKQFLVTQDALQKYPEAELFPYGVYDENTVLRFSPLEGNEGSAKISEAGSIEVEVRKLDDLLGDRKVTFIKMDIEGSELAALRGAERIIREQRPKLAISAYHKPEDIWEIPSLILQYHPDYKLYLRHYSITETETVLYAV